MKLMVTGGAGFVGSNFIRYMLDRYPDYTIINYDLMAGKSNLVQLFNEHAYSNYHVVRGDICDAELVRETVRFYEIDAIVNCAATSAAATESEHAASFAWTNVLGAQVLLDVCREQRVRRFVQISTGMVYGSLGETGYFTEDSPLAPSSPSAASKAAADLLVRSYYETYGLHVNVTRSAYLYGPFHYQADSAVPMLVTSVLQNKQLPELRDGFHVRDWLHVMDHASAIDLVLHEGQAGEVYNIGSFNERRQLDVAELIAGLLKTPTATISCSQNREDNAHRRYAMDPSKLAQSLGWKPKFTFEQGIEETVAWFERNQENWVYMAQ